MTAAVRAGVAFKGWNRSLVPQSAAPRGVAIFGGVFHLGGFLASNTLPNGEKIQCMSGVDSDAFNDVVNSYCFIMGTFTVDQLHGSKVGVQVPHPGVGPHEPDDPITYHTYYQWVPFVLFIQGIVFYVPHWIWKRMEGGLFRSVIQKLSIKDYLGDNLKTYFARDEQIKSLCQYALRHSECQRGWALKFFFCELLNLVALLFTFFFTDWFLNGEFVTYGSDVISMAGLDPENRTDPMAAVFPRVAKCTFKSFGSSGTIQVRDVMCLIATNIINEKIFLHLWVWQVLLMCVTGVWLLYRALTILLPFFRRFLLQQRVKVSTQGDVEVVMRYCTLSDWFLLMNLSANMEVSVFSEFIHEYAKTLAKNSTFDADDKANMNSVSIGYRGM